MKYLKRNTDYLFKGYKFGPRGYPVLSKVG